MDSLRGLTADDWLKIEEVRIYGGGPLAEEVGRHCTTLQQGGRPVVLGGYLNQQEAAELLAWADYLLLPSRIESIPVIFSDAMQAGCPIISTPIGDLPRLLSTYNCGRLARATDSVSYTRAIRRTLNSSPVDFKIGIQEAREKFDLEATVDFFLTHISHHSSKP